MIHLRHAIFRLDADLRAIRVPWAFVGGIAVAVRAMPRFTNDIDVAIAVGGDREAERIALTLRGRGYSDHPEQPFLENPDGSLRAVRMLSPKAPQTSLVVDLLFRFSGVESEVVNAAQLVTLFPGQALPVVRTGHLLALKVHAGRPKDEEDVRQILRVASDSDLHLARETLQLIDRRGFSKVDDLLAELAKLRDSLRES